MTPPVRNAPRRSVSLRSTVRTVVMSSLFLFLLLLRFCVHHLEQYVTYIKQQHKLDASSNQTKDASTDAIDPNSSNHTDTLFWENDISSQRRRRAPYHSIAHMKEIYWNQVLQSGVLDFDIHRDDDLSSSRRPGDAASYFSAVRRAAEHGHAVAQQLYANALVAGFWTTATDNTIDKRSNKKQWRVSDNWWMVEERTAPEHSNVTSNEAEEHHSILQQQAQAMLLWNMAAVAGNVDAMVTLGYRTEEQMALSSPSLSPAAACQRSLPYYAAAAHHIMDTLMDDVQYRGQMAPSQDRHILYQLHVHGSRHGSSPQDLDNLPDESGEALQFFKIKAAALLAQQAAAAKGKKKKSSTHPLDASVTKAAYTLGRYYHLGLRGIPANLTLAVQYYTAAAQAGHWEAAGQGGMLLFWHLGMNTTSITSGHREEAFRLFHLGAPFDLQGCQLRYQLKVSQAQQQKLGGHAQDPIYVCDSESLNGLGLVYLFGLPSKNISINLPIATEFFELARDQGNANAAYHLAMMKLGWRTHYSIHSGENRTVDDEAAATENVEFLDVDNGDDGISAAMSKAELLFPLEPKENSAKTPQNHLTISEYKNIVTDLATASKKGHIMARHRLAMIYEKGIPLKMSPGESDSSSKKQQVAQGMAPKYVVAPDCTTATDHYKWILEYASPTLAKRMRRGYQEYMAGNYVDSLRNYLLVSETGHGIAQMNAAFLLEQGVCLGLNAVDCAKASVRLWKAVAKRGSAEASMRVGDFYYYGRFRDAKDRIRGENSIPVGPWGWIDYLIYPEKHIIPLLWNEMKRQIINFSVWEPLSILDLPSAKQKMSHSSQKQDNDEPTCNADAAGEDGSCPAVDLESSRRVAFDKDEDLDRRRRQLDEDLAMAAHYYQMAADRMGTARAHFNLGFMYEWGLGLKQDFPLAKRQYDLAVSSLGYSQEADIPVSLALMSLSIHEYFVKLKLSWDRYWATDPSSKDESPSPDVEL